MIDEMNQDSVVSDNQVLTSETPAALVPQEKMLTQSEVNEIAGRTRKDAYEKGRRDGETTMQRPNPTTAEQVASGAVSEDQVRDLIIKETQRIQEGQARQFAAQRVVNEFSNKVAAGASQYEDFEEKVSQLDLPKIPEIVSLANSVDNTADVMYELGNNPSKIAILKTLAQTSPKLAMLEMNKLSNSIKTNREAQQAGQPPEPLSQVKPSTAPVDGGQMSVSDYRKQSWLKR